MITKKLIDFIIDLMRNAVRSIFLVTTIALSFFVLWFVVKFLHHFMRWLNMTIFSGFWGGY